MAKNKLLATEPAGDAALLNGQPVKEKHESIWKDVFAGSRPGTYNDYLSS